MKIPAIEKTILTNNLGAKEQYKVLVNAKLMNILSDRIYSNKPRAVVRELATNAIDAHVKAGTTATPFKVWLPSTIDKTFKIRDYGCGLSPEDVIALYSTYGASDKTESNDYIGFMGLGSKSPFCLVTSFTTNSYFNGKKYTFINFKDENDIPNISYVGESDTTEPNGLEISMIVKPDVVQNFKDDAAFIFAGLDYKPLVYFSGDKAGKLVTNPISMIHSPDMKAHGINLLRFDINKRSNGYSYSYTQNKDFDWSTSISLDQKVYARMGGILYHTTITWGAEHIRAIAEYLMTRDNIGTVDNYTFLVLDFSIGDLDIATDREKLQYTGKTNDALNKRIKQFTECITASLEQITESKTLNKFGKKVYFSKLPSFRQLIDWYRIINNTFGNVLSTFFGGKIEIPSQEGLRVYPEMHRSRQKHFIVPWQQYSVAPSATDKKSVILLLTKDTKFFNDKLNEAIPKYFFVCLSEDPGQLDGVKTLLKKEGFEYFDEKKTSELPDVVKEKKPKAPAKRIFDTVRCFGEFGSGTVVSDDDLKDIDRIFYVPIFKHEIVSFKNDWTASGCNLGYNVIYDLAELFQYVLSLEKNKKNILLKWIAPTKQEMIFIEKTYPKLQFINLICHVNDILNTYPDTDFLESQIKSILENHLNYDLADFKKIKIFEKLPEFQFLQLLTPLTSKIPPELRKFISGNYSNLFEKCTELKNLTEAEICLKVNPDPKCHETLENANTLVTLKQYYFQVQNQKNQFATQMNYHTLAKKKLTAKQIDDYFSLIINSALSHPKGNKNP